jgi:hypothetical protein
MPTYSARLFGTPSSIYRGEGGHDGKCTAISVYVFYAYYETAQIDDDDDPPTRRLLD